MTSALPGERTLAGVLVTDLVESTVLRSRLGDEAVENLRRSHQRLLGDVTERHQGQVVHWLGDGILAIFPSATAATRAAIGIQQCIDRENRRPNKRVELSVRVGVSAGDVIWSEADCTGVAVDEAYALCNAAYGGEIQAAPSVLELAGSRISVSFSEAAGDALLLSWHPIRSAAPRLGLPPGLPLSGELPFVGREALLGTLHAMLIDAAGGDARLAVVRGEAGIGKTRLLTELAHKSLSSGALVLYGAAEENLALPYEPVAQILRDWMERVDDVVIRLGSRAGELVRLVPELREWVPDLPPPTSADAETERRRLFGSVADWIATMTLDDPIVLILDSLHWADDSTLSLLRHIMRPLRSCRVLIVIAHRPEDHRADGLARHTLEVLGPRALARFDLEGLTHAETEELVGRTTQQNDDSQLSSALHLVTSGNPLHLAELLRAREQGPRSSDLHQTVRTAMQANVDQLSHLERSTIETASVIGRQFDAALIAQVQPDVDAAYEALDAAVRAGLVEEVDRPTLRYAFVHDLTRETVYSAIGAARLARLHERIGLALERRVEEGSGEFIAELARHFRAAVALGHRDRAIRYTSSAARRALKQYANETAARLYSQALLLLADSGDPGEASDLLIGRGEALRRIGDPTYRSILLKAATDAGDRGDGERMGRALLATYRGTFSRAIRVDTEKVDRLQKALELIGGADRPLRARLLALLAVELVWADDRQQSVSLSDQAVAVARSLGDDAILAEVLAERQWVVFHPLKARLTTTTELNRLAAASSNPLHRFEAAGSDVFTTMRSGNRAGLERALQIARRISEELDQPMVRWMLLIREVAVALMEGRFPEAEACIDEGRELAARTDQPDARSQHSVQRFWLDFDVEPPEEARQSVAAAARAYRQLPPLIAWPPVLYRCCDLGLDTLAAPILSELTSRGLDRIPIDQIWLWSMCQIAAAASHLCERPLAAELLPVLEHHVDEHANMVFGTLGSTARYVGLLHRVLGHVDQAEGAFRAAIVANDAMNSRPWTARTQLDLARLRFERFGRSDSLGQEMLERAVECASRLGLATVIDHAYELADG